VKTIRRSAKTNRRDSAQRFETTGRSQGADQVHAGKFSSRVGFGNDVHRLVKGRKLILGGVEIPFGKGSFGHSDGDALTHAVCDALLGAAALGDIGRHFPDTSPRWRNASSLRFLTDVCKLLDRTGFRVVNVDATISLEKPKLAPHIDRMRTCLAKALGIRLDQVSVKAKSGEGIGEIGRSEAVKAEAVALLIKED